MKFFEEAYVGFQRGRYTKDDDPRLLGFLVPNGTTKAEKKRIETVDNWADKELSPRVIKNEPVRGFRFLEVVGRYSTANKLFRVLDPRGFELEISADNMLDLIQTTTIVNGEIVTDCVWAQHNRSYLAPATMEEYVFWKNDSKSDSAEFVEGSFYVNPGNLLSVFRFDGIYHHTYLDFEHKADKHVTEIDSTNRNFYGTRSNHRVQEYTTHVDIKMNSGKKPSYIYTEFSLDEQGSVKTKTVHIRKSHFRGLAEYKEDVSQEMKDFTYDLQNFMMTSYVSWERSKKRGFTENMNIAAPYSAFFKDKEDALKFDYSAIIEGLKPGNRYSNSVKVDDHDQNSYYYPGSVSLDPGAKQNFKISDLRA